MKKLILCILLYGLVIKPLSARNYIPFAISEIIRDFYVERSVQFDFITHNSMDLRDFMSEVGKLCFRENFPINVVQVREGEGVIHVRRSAILLFDNLKTYHDFHARAILRNQYPKQFYFLVYILNFDERETQSLITQNLTSMFRFETLLLLKNGSLHLITFEQFQQPKCREWQISELNQFSRVSRKWKNRNYFPKKFKTFNGCELVIKVPYPKFPITGVDFDGQGKVIKTWGFGVFIFEEIGKSLNFTIYYNPHYLSKDKYENQSIEHDFSIQMYSFRYFDENSLYEADLSRSIMTNEELVLISRSEPYTQFEKLFLPFDVDTWLWLSITLSIAVLTIFILRFAPKNIQRFVFGTRVQTPMMNLM